MVLHIKGRTSHAFTLLVLLTLLVATTGAKPKRPLMRRVKKTPKPSPPLQNKPVLRPDVKVQARFREDGDPILARDQKPERVATKLMQREAIREQPPHLQGLPALRPDIKGEAVFQDGSAVMASEQQLATAKTLMRRVVRPDERTKDPSAHLLKATDQQTQAQSEESVGLARDQKQTQPEFKEGDTMAAVWHNLDQRTADGKIKATENKHLDPSPDDQVRAQSKEDSVVMANSRKPTQTQSNRDDTSAVMSLPNERTDPEYKSVQQSHHQASILKQA